MRVEARGGRGGVGGGGDAYILKYIKEVFIYMLRIRKEPMRREKGVDASKLACELLVDLCTK